MTREAEIERYSHIGIDKETYDLLRAQKTKQEKSMMRIIKNLVIEKYADNHKRGQYGFNGSLS